MSSFEVPGWKEFIARAERAADNLDQKKQILITRMLTKINESVFA